jgi:hypothetical protein
VDRTGLHWPNISRFHDLRNRSAARIAGKFFTSENLAVRHMVDRLMREGEKKPEALCATRADFT